MDEYLTVKDMMNLLGLPRKTIEQRLARKGFKPVFQDAVYLKEHYEAIKNTPKAGRPKKETLTFFEFQENLKEPAKKKDAAGKKQPEKKERKRKAEKKTLNDTESDSESALLKVNLIQESLF